MYLYKYVRTMDAVLNIAKGLLKFSPPAELNDPSELTATLDLAAVRNSLETLRSKGMTENQYKWILCQNALLSLLAPKEKALDAPRTLTEANRMLSNPAYDKLEYMQKKLFTTIELIRCRIGILSLSERYDSLPMWAHYSNLARGVVVILKGLENTFNGDNTGSLNCLKPVDYVQEFLGMTFDPATQDRLFFSKLKDWSYEREWRIVTALDTCKPSPDGNLYLRSVPSPLAGVICGWHVTDQEKAQLCRILRQVNPEVKVTTAALIRGNVVLDPEFRSKLAL